MKKLVNLYRKDMILGFKDVSRVGVEIIQKVSDLVACAHTGILLWMLIGLIIIEDERKSRLVNG